MRIPRRLSQFLAAALLAFSMLPAAPGARAAEQAMAAPWNTPAAAKLDNAACLECHDAKKKIETATADGAKRTLRGIAADKYDKGVHASMLCVDCHSNIVEVRIGDETSPHRKAAPLQVDCAKCHQALWDTAQKEGKAKEKPRLETVVRSAEAYARSFHAGQNAKLPGRKNATCDECHDTHAFNVPVRKKGPEYDNWRLRIPDLCGNCHEKPLKAYDASVHGKEVREVENAEAAVCTDCHTTHEIGDTKLSAFKLLNPNECGNCHRKHLKTYRDTYHGQVSALGGDYTAKCYDCHGGHDILRVDDEKSRVHPNNKLGTCRTCHDGKKDVLATAGFATFSPHAHAGDYKRYPEIWIAARFMLALLATVFAFFWLHSGLWYYREWKDRKAGVTRRAEPLQPGERRQVRRFGLGWRLAHLVFALATMTLVLTGTTALFSASGWAPVVADTLGGARNLALAHRVAAMLFLGIFLGHFFWMMHHLLVRRRAGFRWLGPDSLIPNRKDFRDCYEMFRWFVGKGPRPAFDRWAYFEKFDYWAVFWGVAVIGGSGLALAFPHVTAHFLPGWVLNVATLVHGEEAFLAAVFLFTVHFFNNHFRPDKLPPPDIVMFTGSLPLEDFRRDHLAQYNRLVETGELEKYLVDAPSPQMTRGSKILGIVLIGFGLALLVLVLVGVFAEI